MTQYESRARDGRDRRGEARRRDDVRHESTAWESEAPVADSGVAEAESDLRRKVLTIVLLCAVAPTLLLGLLTYWTATSLIHTRIERDLVVRLSQLSNALETAIAERVAETERWAEHLAADTAVASGRTERDASLERLRLLAPHFLELAIYDDAGVPLARAGRELSVLPGRVAAVRTPRDRVEVQSDGREPQVIVQRSLPAPSPQGHALVSVGLLTDLWSRLRAETVIGGGRFLIVGTDRVPLFDSARTRGGALGPVPSVGVAASLGLGGRDQGRLLEYRNEADVPVLAMSDYLEHRHLGIVVEIAPETAGGPMATLRRIMIATGLTSLMVLLYLGRWLARRFTRPIDDLIAAARVSAEGGEPDPVPVRVGGQVGELTRACNQMMRELAMARERVKELSVTDELTGLHNRSYVHRAIDRELSAGRRSRHTFSLILFDLDRFQQVNDELGHLMGDSMLREFSAVLTGDLRPTDVVARYEGVEFVVVLPGTGKGEAGAVAERIRQRFAGRDLEMAEGRRLTVSAGVASYPDDGGTRTEMLVNLQSAVSRAKRLGRNRVEVCQAA